MAHHTTLPCFRPHPQAVTPNRRWENSAGTRELQWSARVLQQNTTPAGCSKSLSSKATGESKPEAYPLGYVEDFDEPRTKLADFFSTLLGALEAGLQKRDS